MKDAKIKKTALFPKLAKTSFASATPSNGCSAKINKPVAAIGIASVIHNIIAIAKIASIIKPSLLNPAGVGKIKDKITMNKAIAMKAFRILLESKIKNKKIFILMKNRHKLRKKEAKELRNQIKNILGCEIDNEIEIAEYENWKIFFINGKFLGLFIDNSPFLNVEGLKKYKATKRFVTVDDGAIKFILNGADVMAPGITSADENIRKGDIVWIRDERGLPLAIGKALMSGKEMVLSKKGKAVENLHHIGDKLWKLSV